jgi:colanic acid/amylovoran biosynthesis protein
MTTARETPLTLSFFGAAPDTPNLGVSALCQSFLEGILEREPDARIAVFDNGFGVRPGTCRVQGTSRSYTLFGGRNSRRFHRSDTLWNIRCCARVGGLWNPASRAILSSQALVDISGGDSFTDLYGPRRFEGITLPKLTALENGVPLVLLPQTYGPFDTARCREIARKIVRGAACAWARDERSFVVLRELLGPDFDASKHRCGVDIAFAMTPCAPAAESVPAELERWLASPERRPVIGFNVSGLIYRHPVAAREQYKFRADYRETVVAFLRRILRDSDARIALVPHVFGDRESDAKSCEAVVAALGSDAIGRILVVPGVFDATEIKWVISRLDWFCGMRMHSTIAALSTGVPTAAIAYSMKTRGVFESCDQGSHVADPRDLDTADVVDRLWSSWLARTTARETLRAALPRVLAKAAEQMDSVIATCRGKRRHEEVVSER